MKLFRFRENGKIKPGIFVNNKHYDASSIVNDYNESFFENYYFDFIKTASIDNLPEITFEESAFESCIARPSKIVCIGLNYATHAKESDMAIPTEPVVFLKATTSLCGAFDDIMIPKDSIKTDWEVELSFIIGKKASYVEYDEAMDYIAGYCLHNDVSEREYQLERGGTWDKGKGCDTFAPMGPYFVSKDEITDPHNLNLWLTVNGKTMQQGNTADFIFNIPTTLSYVSKFMTLLPGDIVSTGTPAGVGLGFKPPIYLKPGDIVELGIDRLGTSKQHVIAYKK